MDTHSAIGYMRPDGSIRAVYCHWDGSPSHHLPILTEHYNSLRKVQALIRPGSMSQLRTTQLWESDNDPETGEYSPQRKPQPLYHHERGNGPWNCNGAIQYAVPPSVSPDLDTAFTYWRAFDCEWIYLLSPEDGWVHYSLS